MEAREIIIKLVNTGKITGEEAAVLFEAIYTKTYYGPCYKTDYQLAVNKDLEGTDVSSTTGFCDTKPWTETCDN